MPLLQQIERCLSDAGYRLQVRTDGTSTVFFEDYSLFGFATVYDSVRSLLDNWSTNQDEFLQKQAPFLRVAARKAWNCYTVHLTGDSPSTADLQRLFEIEEDFTSTRKIARGSLVTAADVQRALYPLIPIQNLLKMQAGQSDAGIAQRFHDWPQSAVRALLGKGTAEELVELLLEGE